MKKTIFAATAAFFLLSAVACSQSGAQSGKVSDRDETYTGILPAADVDGIRYTLRLDYNDDHGNTDGDYDLVQSYLVADTAATTGFRDSVSFNSKGDFTVETGTGEQAGISYLKLVPDRKYADADTLYFLVSSDSTLTLTNAQLDAPVSSALNYTLTLVK